MKIKRIRKITSAIAVLCLLVLAGRQIKFWASPSSIWASPSSGLTRTFIGRGTYQGFMVNTDENRSLNPVGNAAPFQYIAKAQPAVDVEVDTHSYAPGASTGWHKHPGPVYITVNSGELTFYEYDDPTCSPHVYKAGQGFVDYGSGHIGFNRDPDNPASDVTLGITYVGGPFRSELPAPGPYCAF